MTSNYSSNRQMRSVSAKHKYEEKEYHDSRVKLYSEKYYNGGWLAYRFYLKCFSAAYFRKRGIVLDLGCGPFPSLMDPNIYDNAMYCCVDISIHSLLNVRNKCKTDNSHLILCDAECLPFRNESFDTVVSFGLLHHLFQPRRGIEEIHRVLNTGGYFVAHEPSIFWNGQMESPHERGFHPKEIYALLEGFVNVRILTQNYPHLRSLLGLMTRICRRLALDRYEPYMWILGFEVEHIIDVVGLKGTDYLIVAQNHSRTGKSTP